MNARILMLLAALATSATLSAEPPSPATPGADRILNPDGAPAHDDFFPIAVWLQSPRNAPRFKAAGINLYVGLWSGPTESQLSELKKAGMPVICDQNSIGIAHLDDPLIAGWMHGDEPDNAQELGKGGGYGPPILPEKIVAEYQQMHKADPSRPVLLNLGQGVAWDDYIGRGVRRNHPEDYAAYVKGCDIASFDIYPVTHTSPDITGKLEYVARGVERLSEWTHGEKGVWNCIECTHISNPGAKATPEQVRSMVWMSLIRGSRGLIYFVHQFKPVFKEAALLDDPEMLAAVTAINRQIHELAPVLNSPSIDDGVVVETSEPESPIAAMVKRHDRATYVFAVNLHGEPVKGSFSLRDRAVGNDGAVLGEARRVALEQGRFTDTFAPYAVHLYSIAPAGN